MKFLTRHGFLLGVAILVSGCGGGHVASDTASLSSTESNQPVASDEVDPAEVRARAQKARKLGKTDEALYHYVTLLEHEPKNEEALLAVGEIHHEKGNDSLSKAAYLMAIEINPNNAAAQEGLALSALNLREETEAKAAALKALAIDPHRWRCHNALGLMADRQGHHGDASRHYNLALAEQPRSEQVLNNLGYSKFMTGDVGGAIESSDHALRLNPHYQPALLNKGLYLTKSGRSAEALEVFRQSLNEADACNNLGFLLMQEGDYLHAREYLERAIRVSPSYHQLANQNIHKLDLMLDRQLSQRDGASHSYP